jgi:steroid delta-isomerase-like uncharacterized protein
MTTIEHLAEEREWGISTELTDEEQANMAAFESVFPHWNSHDVTSLIKHYNEDIVFVNIAMGETYNGKAAVRSFLEELFTALPDLELDVTLRVPRGKYVAEEYHIRGHHRGDFFGIPATGKYLDIACVSMVELRDGKLKEDHFYFDVASTLAQMGLVPSVAAMRGPIGRGAMRLLASRSRLGRAGAAAAGLVLLRKLRGGGSRR